MGPMEHDAVVVGRRVDENHANRGFERVDHQKLDEQAFAPEEDAVQPLKTVINQRHEDDGIGDRFQEPDIGLVRA